MRKRLRVLLAVGLVLGVLLTSTGCLFNLFQTARMIGSGNAAITLGTGLINILPGEDPNWNLTPQVRLTFGLSDKVDLGMQTGALVPLSTGDFGWLGAKGDVKFSIVDDPETFSLAMGIGGGNGIEFFGWGLFAEVLFDVNATVPLFFVYQPTIPLSEEDFVLWHHVAGGLKLAISENAVLLLIADYRSPELFSFGLAIQIGF